MTDSSNANDAAAAELLHDFDVEYDEPAQFRTVRLERCFAGSDGPLADVDPGPPRCKVWAAGGTRMLRTTLPQTIGNVPSGTAEARPIEVRNHPVRVDLRQTRRTPPVARSCSSCATPDLVGSGSIAGRAWSRP